MADPLYVPLHYIVTDSTGQSAVIEFIGGKPNVYRCSNGVMTNWPTYDWQTTNVKDYFNLTLFGGCDAGAARVGNRLNASR